MRDVKKSSDLHHRLLTLLFAGLFFTVSNSYSATIAYWQLDGANDSRDVVNNDGMYYDLNLTGVLNNYSSAVTNLTNPDQSIWRTGFGTARDNPSAQQFTGSQKWTRTKPHPFGFYPKSSFTVEGWFKSALISDGIKPFISSRTSVSGWKGWDVRDYLSKGVHLMIFLIVDGNNVSKQLQANIESDRWYHFAAIWDGNNGNFGKMSLYLAGQLKASLDIQQNLKSTDGGDFRIGESFIGMLDEIRFSNKALRADEFLNYTAKVGRLKTIAYWQLNNIGSQPDLIADDNVFYDLQSYGSASLAQPAVNIIPNPETGPRRINSDSPFCDVNSISLSGNDGFFLFDENDIFKFSTNWSFTFEGWVKLTGLQSIQCIAGTRQYASGWSGWELDAIANGSKLRFTISDKSANQEFIDAPVSLNNWYHFACVWCHDKGQYGTMEFYLNGNLAGSISGHPLWTGIYGGRLALGTRSAISDINGLPVWQDIPLTGCLDEVRFTYGALRPISFLNGGDYCGGQYHSYPFTDLSKDCGVDFRDFSVIAENYFNVNNDAHTQVSMRKYEVYSPNIKKAIIVDSTDSNNLQHNNAPAIAHYRGKYYAVWYGNFCGIENSCNQKIYYSTSVDNLNWTLPQPIAENPNYPNLLPPWGIQAQFGLFNLNHDQELWCIFTCVGGNIPHRTYLARLIDPADGWKFNRDVNGSPIALIADINIPALHDGITYYPFASGNPALLANGRIIMPMILQQKDESWMTKWSDRRKYAASFYTDDNGSTWHLDFNSIVSAPKDDKYNIWENSYVQQHDGKVRLFARNNASPISSECLITALGDSNASNFGPSIFSHTRTIISRPGFLNDEFRKYMVHCDNANIESWRDDRKNAAIYTSRSGMDDFIAGICFAPGEYTVTYPQMCENDGKLQIIYGALKAKAGEDIHQALGINVQVSILDPAPGPDSYLIMPRSDVRNIISAEDRAYDADSKIETRIDHIKNDNVDYLRFYGNASAGMEVDIVDPNNSVLTIILPVFIENAEPNKILRLLTIGDGGILLGYDYAEPNQLKIFIDGVWSDAGTIDYGSWNTIEITISAKEIVTRTQFGKKVHLPARSFSGRIYLGDGFPDYLLDGRSRFLIDTAALLSRVQQDGVSGVCGDSNHDYSPVDINYDCMVDYKDIRIFAEDWLKRTY